MRLLHVVPSYLPAVRYGGPIVSVHALCAALVRRGHDVHVFTTNVDGDANSEVPLDRSVLMDGVNVHYFPVSRLRRLYHSPKMAVALASELKSFDLVHLHSVFLWPTWAAAHAARKYHVPYVISPRGMLVKELISRRSPWIKAFWIALIEKNNLRHAAGIHSTSKIETEEMLALGFELKSRPFEISNGVALPTLNEANLKQDANAPFVLALGRISWKKRLDISMEAVARVLGLNFIIAGPDDENLQVELLEKARQLGISDRVKFAGAVSGTEKQRLLETALALIITSVSENFGNVVLESMAAARPVLCVPQVGAAEIIAEANAGAVVLADVAPLADTLNAWLETPELANQLGQNGRRWVEAHYSWDTIAAMMESSCRTILDN